MGAGKTDPNIELVKRQFAEDQIFSDKVMELSIHPTRYLFGKRLALQQA